MLFSAPYLDTTTTTTTTTITLPRPLLPQAYCCCAALVGSLAIAADVDSVTLRHQHRPELLRF